MIAPAAEAVAARAAGDTADALARWLRRPVATGAATLERLPLDALAGGDDAAALLVARVAGALPGTMALELALDDAAALVSCLGGDLPPGGGLAELERSMLEETANIVFTALMNSLARQLALEAVPRSPVAQVDLGAAAWGQLIAEAAEHGDHVARLSVWLAASGGPSLRVAFLPAPAAALALGAGP